MNSHVLPDPDLLEPLLSQLSSAETDPETVVLRTHLVVERLLRSILAIRLDMEAKHLPALQFLQLAKLSLGGKSHNDTLLKVLTLNDLRNKYAHEVATSGLSTAIARYTNKTGIFCPSYVHDNTSPDDMRKTRQAILRLAGISCLTDVWMCLVELLLAKKLFSSDEAARAAATQLAGIRTVHATRLEEQRSLMKTRAP
jgi:hypothetical protein